MNGLRVLAVDDLEPALDELSRLLREAPGVARVEAASDALTALRLIQAAPLDAVFLDIAMPGMDGLELAGLLARMTQPPVVVFVTAYEKYAVSAYGAVGAVGYLLKPVSAERLADALDRVRRTVSQEPAPGAVTPVGQLAAVPVELAGRTRFVRRADVRFVEARGDYVRLHTARDGSHLVRIPICRLEESWRGVGYVRVHRSFLLAVHAVQELRSDTHGGLLAHTDAGDVPVSRRHARELRDRLLEAAIRGDFEGGSTHPRDQR